MGSTIRQGRTVSSIPVGYDREGRRIRVIRRRKDDRLGDCLAYPVVDGPGVALLIVMPPFLAVMALPVFDLLVHFKPGNALNPVNLLILPFAMPLVASFAFTVGYLLLFFGRVLLSSAMGEEMHPRWPSWNRYEIMEELGRWTWAGVMGCLIGGWPAAIYWVKCGDVDPVDWFFLLDLALVGLAYAQMALMAALFHDTLVAANPVTVIRSIGRLGLEYLKPCLVTAVSVMVAGTCWYLVLNRSPGVGLGMLGLWACWVLTLYLLMMACRMLGFLYAQHARTLGWFRNPDRI